MFLWNLWKACTFSYAQEEAEHRKLSGHRPKGERTNGNGSLNYGTKTL